MTKENLLAHLRTGATTVCHAWTVHRKDGETFGFTDHDMDLEVDGILCRADTGMTSKTLQQTTGLSVDNSEAFGALSGSAISATDIDAGRFDGAEVRAFLVNWASPQDFMLQFRGAIGEITRIDGSFKAELRGLTDLLNRYHGMAYTPECSAVLGDSRCRFNLSQPGFSQAAVIENSEDGRVFTFQGLEGFGERWFESGRLQVVDGDAHGLSGVIKIDRLVDGVRRIELWQSLRAEVAAGDSVQLSAGCDKSVSACKTKFANFLNFRGFPHIPGDDWLTSYPVPGRPSGSGSGLLLTLGGS